MMTFPNSIVLPATFRLLVVLLVEIVLLSHVDAIDLPHNKRRLAGDNISYDSRVVSIDCGIHKNTSYTDPYSNITYVSDEPFIGTGINANILTEYQSDRLAKTHTTLRYFPSGQKNCYTLNPWPGKNNSYLIRAIFMYGNYDQKNQPPKFDLLLGADTWTRLEFDNSTHVRGKEIIHRPQYDKMCVCLADIGSGTPFINSLEVRLLNESLYPRQSGSLVQQVRAYVQMSQYDHIYRYDADPYDRIWQQTEMPEANYTVIYNKSSIDFTQNDYKLPIPVMTRAIKPNNNSNTLNYQYVPRNATTQFYFFLHFAEIEMSSVNKTREFNITIGGESYGTLTLIEGKEETVYNSKPISGSTINITLQKTERSTLPPILNAFEIYKVNNISQKDVSCKPKKKTRFNYLVVVIPVAALLILSTVGLRIRKRLSMWRQTRYNQDKRAGLARFSYTQVMNMTKRFEVQLGRGGSALVYYGCLREDGTEVAVKELLPSTNGTQQFNTEVELLVGIRHKNLVSLIGYCDERDKLILIYEYMAKGTLRQNLSETGNTLTWKQRISVAIDAAQGLDYLHNGCRPPIIHRDVTTANILLNDRFQAKVADFGLSKILPDDERSHVSTRVMGTPGYLDPEYYNTYHLNEKSDVYSLGIVLLELITGKPSIVRNQTSGGTIGLFVEVAFLLEGGDILRILDQRIADQITNLNSVWRMLDMAMLCLKITGSERPTMNTVVTELKECLAMEMEEADSGGDRSTWSQERSDDTIIA